MLGYENLRNENTHSPWPFLPSMFERTQRMAYFEFKMKHQFEMLVQDFQCKKFWNHVCEINSDKVVNVNILCKIFNARNFRVVCKI